MQQRILLGIFCLCLGIAVFSLQDALIKDISGAYPVTEAIAIRAIVALPILLAVVHLDTGVGAIFAGRIGFLTVRALIMFGAYGTYYLALPALPLADAVALFFTAPLFILLLAGPYLGERVSWKSLVSVAAGMIGVVIMLRSRRQNVRMGGYAVAVFGSVVCLVPIDGAQGQRHGDCPGDDLLPERRLSRRSAGDRRTVHGYSGSSMPAIQASNSWSGPGSGRPRSIS